MKMIALSVVLLAAGSASASEVAAPATPIPEIQIAALCFHTGEQVSGMNKICYYDCLGSATAITVKSYQLCPLTIQG